MSSNPGGVGVDFSQLQHMEGGPVALARLLISLDEYEGKTETYGPWSWSLLDSATILLKPVTREELPVYYEGFKIEDAGDFLKFILERYGKRAITEGRQSRQEFVEVLKAIVSAAESAARKEDTWSV